MSLLDRLDAFLFTPYATVYMPPPKDDKAIALLLYTFFLVAVVITCGHYCAK
jgi:hypothetical protein